jgi:hypothetical protein
MRKAFGVAAFAIAGSIWHCQPSFGYTQGDCDQLKKAQTDGSGRQIDAKMQADAQGNCEPKPPNSKEVEAPASK